MVLQAERDFPKGHPKATDYDPASPEAIEWRRRNVHLKGERDWPVDHPAAIDTPGNRNTAQWTPGVDPLNPTLEAFTGRTQEQAAAVSALNTEASAKAQPSPIVQPGIAPDPVAIMARATQLIAEGKTGEEANKIALGEAYDAMLHRATKP